MYLITWPESHGAGQARSIVNPVAGCDFFAVVLIATETTSRFFGVVSVKMIW